MEFDELLKSFEHLIKENQNKDLFGSSNPSVAAERLCLDFLKARGYSVREPIVYPFKIKKLDDLIVLFGGLVQRHYPKNILPYTNDKRDRKIAKALVEGRMRDDNINRAAALQQCGQIIHTVFENLDRFNFEGVPSFGVFGQKNMGWVTDKALQLMNEKIKREEEINLEIYIKNLEKEESLQDDGGYTMEDLKAAEKRLEEAYGKEKG